MKAAIMLHPALTHAQAMHVCREHGLQVTQDGRGNLTVEPCPHVKVWPIVAPRSNNEPTGPEAA